MKGSIYVFLAACSYGVLSTIVVLAYGAGFTLNDVVGSQMVIGAALLWLLVLARRRSLNDLPSRFGVARIMLAGASTGTTGLLYYATLQYLSPTLAVILFFQFTWMGMIVDAVVQRRKPRLSQIVALVFIIIGTVLETGLLNDGDVHFNWQGLVLGLLAAMSNTALIFVSGRIAPQCDPILRSTLMVTGGAIVTSLIVPPVFLLNATILSSLLSSYGLLLAFFGSVFSVWMLAKGAPLISTGLAAIVGSMQLPVTMLVSVLVLDVPVSVSQLAGIFVILAGVIISESKPHCAKLRTMENTHGY